MQGPFLKGEQAKEPLTTREAAKACLRDYVLLDWTLEGILTAFTRFRGETWEAQIGGVVEGESDQGQQRVGREQIAVTRLRNSSCFAVYDVAELIAEIRREADCDEEKDEAREAVKAIIQVLLDDGTPEEEIMTLVGPASTRNWRIQIGGEIIEQGEPRPLDRQVAVIRSGHLHWTIFDLAEIVDELRQEEPKAEEQPARAIQQEEAQRCWNCGKPLEIKAGAGRDRHFCENNGRCRVAYHRKLQRQQQREAILQENTALLDSWQQQHHITGPLLTLLQEILINEGQDAAQAATDAIRGYASEQAKEQAEEIAQLELTISILKRQLDLEYRFLIDTQARGLISFLQKEPQAALTPFTEKILAHAQELPSMASHARYASYLRRKQLLASEEELAEFKELWKRLMVETAQDKYADF